MDFSKEFIKKLKNGEKEAFTQLYRETKPIIFSFIRFKVRGDLHLAEDILSEVYMDALRYGPSLTLTHNVLAWLYRIARSKIADHVRKIKRIKQLYKTQRTVAIHKEILNAFSDESVSSLLDKEDELIITIGFSRLPAEYREVLMKKHIKDKSVKEIATELKKTTRSVESILYRGKKLLEKEVKKALNEKIYFITGGGEDNAG